MKKVYETPTVEKVNFDYKNQVVAPDSVFTEMSEMISVRAENTFFRIPDLALDL